MARSSASYLYAIRRFVGAQGLWDAVDLAGTVTPEELTAYYRGADVYVSLSEHEGFGAPLLEAMYNGIPIVAYSESAVPETVGDAGLLLTSKEPVLVAGAIHRVLTDQGLRDKLVAAGRRRLAEFDLGRSRLRFRQAVERALEES